MDEIPEIGHLNAELSSSSLKIIKNMKMATEANTRACSNIRHSLRYGGNALLRDPERDLWLAHYIYVE